MSGIFNSFVKGLSGLASQDDPSFKVLRAKNELSELEDKEIELFAVLGRRVYADGGQGKYPDLAIQLEALSVNRSNIQQRMREAEEEKLANEKAASALEEDEGCRRCPGCDTPNPVGAKFCQACGEKLDLPTQCISCGADISPGALFCGECGAKQEA